MAEKVIREVMLTQKSYGDFYQNMTAALPQGASVVRCVHSGYAAPTLICVVDPVAPTPWGDRNFIIVAVGVQVAYDEARERLAYVCLVETFSHLSITPTYLFEVCPLA